MRTLIFGTSYVEGQHARYVFGLWADLVRRLNPDADVLVVDSASPDMPRLTPGVAVKHLDGNIGHLQKHGRDGWGRAFSSGLQSAILCGYDYVVHIECDLLFARPVSETLEKMSRCGVEFAAPMAAPHPFIETALMFMSVDYIQRTDLIGRYDWENSPQEPYPEERIAALTNDALFTLPLRGLRNDYNAATARNLGKLYQGGIEWITHCTDPAVLRAFLKVNGCE